jgi:hypothetical protein
LNKIQSPEQGRKYPATMDETTDGGGMKVPNAVNDILKKKRLNAVREIISSSP